MGSAVAAVERTHEQKLDLLAEVAVKVGLGLKEGRELVMTASLDAVAWHGGLPNRRIAREHRW